MYSTDNNERRLLGEKDFPGNAQSVELPLPLHNNLEFPIWMQEVIREIENMDLADHRNWPNLEVRNATVGAKPVVNQKL
ncbi:hypothetical protein V6N11_054110 [Hibiscus sabdariffa]|uniref:Uncharacterized protein n=1 Tax=Hibiscus sabdariffa TaxID=183260 RepID=A0ABR2S3T1_9ROSI